MLNIAIILFTLAILGGIFLLSYVLENKNTPKGIALIHGSFAALGLILLIIYAFLHSPSPIASIILFIVAALGGFLLFYRDITGKSMPKWLAVGHGFIALSGFITLLFFVFFLK